MSPVRPRQFERPATARALCFIYIPRNEVENMGYYPRLKDLREDQDLTQRELGKLLGMPHTQYWRYEQGLQDIPTEVLLRLADLYRTSTDYILGRTNDPAPPRGV